MLASFVGFRSRHIGYPPSADIIEASGFRAMRFDPAMPHEAPRPAWACSERVGPRQPLGL
jgi:hypothetical protein